MDSRQIARMALVRPERRRNALQECGHFEHRGLAAHLTRFFDSRASIQPSTAHSNGTAYGVRLHAAPRVVSESSHASTSATTKPIARGPSFTGRGNVPDLMRRRTSLSLSPMRSNSAGMRMMLRGWFEIDWNLTAIKPPWDSLPFAGIGCKSRRQAHARHMSGMHLLFLPQCALDGTPRHTPFFSKLKLSRHFVLQIGTRRL